MWAASWENLLFRVQKQRCRSFHFIDSKFIFFPNPKFQVSYHLLWLYSPVYAGPGRKPQRQVFSQCGSYVLLITYLSFCHDVHIFPWLVVYEHVRVDRLPLVDSNILIHRTINLAFQRYLQWKSLLRETIFPNKTVFIWYDTKFDHYFQDKFSCYRDHNQIGP